MSDQIELAYEAEKKRGVITFPNGRKLTLAGVTEEQAKNFVARHAEEFQRRDCVLHTSLETRSADHG